MSITKADIREEHNHLRRQAGLRPLQNSPGLNDSAQKVARRKARRDKGIDHDRLWWKVIDAATRRRFGAKGENLAWRFSDVQSLMRAWINSVLHRRNILSNDFDRLGVGIATSARGNVYVVVHFGGKR